MSLATEDPDGFSRWLGETEAAADDPDAVAPGGELFPRRALFGRYVADEVALFLASGAIRHERARVAAAECRGDGYAVRLDDGRTLFANVLVLAATHPPPSIPAPLLAVSGHPGFHADPYDGAKLEEIGQDDRVLVVGTGLTMADTVASLDRRGHRGTIVALSRHGWRSHGHALLPVEPSGDFRTNPARSVTALFSRVRQALARAAAAGSPWQAVFDALRQQGPAIWDALPERERARLLRHARTLWDVHRFRIAPQVEAVLDRRIADGSLEILAASLRASRVEGDDIAVALRPRHRRDAETRRFDHLVLTTGPGHGGVARTKPLFASLVASGDLRPDAHGLGLLTSQRSEAIGQDGQARERLFVAGPLSRAAFGELMGLPEVTLSAERVADRIAWLVERQSAGHRSHRDDQKPPPQAWSPSRKEEAPMSKHTYKLIEIVGSSPVSIEDAISSAIADASKTVRNIRWFEVLETRGHVENGEVAHYQVTLKLGFTLED